MSDTAHFCENCGTELTPVPDSGTTIAVPDLPPAEDEGATIALSGIAPTEEEEGATIALSGLAPSEEEEEGATIAIPGLAPAEEEEEGATIALPGLAPSEEEEGTTIAVPGLAPSEEEEGATVAVPGLAPSEEEEGATVAVPGLAPSEDERATVIAPEAGETKTEQPVTTTTIDGLKAGQILQERYRLERMLGKGGFGAAYLAQDVKLKRGCVVKQMLIPRRTPRREREIYRANFEREASLLAQLNHPGHPNIPEIYDYFSDAGG